MRDKAFELQDDLCEILNCIDEIDIDSDIEIAEVHTFADAGVMTNNAGLVITMYNGAEYQLTIVRTD